MIPEKTTFNQDNIIKGQRQTRLFFGAAVKRNTERFPEDFMFQVTGEEAEVLRCQTGISKPGRGSRRYLPYVFTEQGVAMLSSVLNSGQLGTGTPRHGDAHANMPRHGDAHPRHGDAHANMRFIIY
jgi:hypothetical protein